MTSASSSRKTTCTVTQSEEHKKGAKFILNFLLIVATSIFCSLSENMGVGGYKRSFGWLNLQTNLKWCQYHWGQEQPGTQRAFSLTHMRAVACWGPWFQSPLHHLCRCLSHFERTQYLCLCVCVHAPLSGRTWGDVCDEHAEAYANTDNNQVVAILLPDREEICYLLLVSAEKC